jgi:hypothetical protein
MAYDVDIKVEEAESFPDDPRKSCKHSALYEIIRNADMDKPYLITLPVKARWTALSRSIMQSFRKQRVPYSVVLRKTEYGPVQTKFYFKKIKRTRGIAAGVKAGENK